MQPLPTHINKPYLPEHSVILPMLQSITRPLIGLTSIHDRYGELVLGRFINKRILFVSHPDCIEQIFSLEGKGLLSREFLYEAKKPLFGNGLINSENAVWSKQRRLMQPVFTREAVKTWERIIVDEANHTASDLASSIQMPINLTAEIKNLIQRIFIRILLGKAVDNIADRSELLTAIDTISRELLPQLVTTILFGNRLKRLVPINTQRYHHAIERLKYFVVQEIENKLDQPGHDLISLFLQASDRNTGYIMPQALLQDESINMFFAGQDTTINTLLWFFYLVGKHASVAEKIANEISQLPDESISSEHLKQLVYTKATLSETLRLYPPTSALATQTLQEIELGDYRVAQGTTVLLSMYATHRNPRLWERPDQFLPERFLDADDQHKFSYFPFGGGLHNCIGRHFAELEMLLVITVLWKKFHFETITDAKEAIGITLKPDRVIMSRVSSRGL